MISELFLIHRPYSKLSRNIFLLEWKYNRVQKSARILIFFIDTIYYPLRKSMGLENNSFSLFFFLYLILRVLDGEKNKSYIPFTSERAQI